MKATDNWSYYLHDGSTEFRFRLAGDLTLRGARELEQVWITASSVIGARRLVVDLREVTSIDPAGRELLDKWHAEGAHLVQKNLVHRPAL